MNQNTILQKKSENKKTLKIHEKAKKFQNDENTLKAKASKDLLEIHPIPIPGRKYRKLFRKNKIKKIYINKNKIDQKLSNYKKTVEYLNSHYILPLPLKQEKKEIKEFLGYKNFILNKNDFESDSEKIFEDENINYDDKKICYKVMKKNIILRFVTDKKILKKKRKIVFDVLKFIKFQSYEVKKKYKCKFCDGYFVGQSALGGHITKNHGEESKNQKNIKISNF